MSVVKFANQFDVDLEPVGNEKEKDGELYACQFKSNGKGFFGKRFSVLNPKISLWFINKEYTNYIKLKMNFIIGNKIYNDKHTIELKFEDEQWRGFDL